jgi:6-phosphogluconolactonase
MAKRALLDHVPLLPENIRRIRGELSPQECADDYIEQLRRAFGLGRMEMPVFDTVLLGLGADGHTASLFPDTEILRRTDVPVAVARVARLNANRISLTYPAINAAREILFLVSGADKAPVVQAILSSKGEQYPAAAIRNAAWLLDAEAASGIGS